MLDHYYRARNHVEQHGWDAFRRFTFAAIGFTALAVVFVNVWDPLFYASAFLAIVLWFVSLGMLMFNVQESAARRAAASER